MNIEEIKKQAANDLIIIDKAELAKWIYWEDSDDYYCSECIDKRLEEINTNKEFAEDIDYENGDDCGYYEDYANEEGEVFCCKCEKSLFSTGVDC